MAEISSLVPINRIEIWSPVETSSGISSSAFNFSSTFFWGGGADVKTVYLLHRYLLINTIRHFTD